MCKKILVVLSILESCLKNVYIRSTVMVVCFCGASEPTKRKKAQRLVVYNALQTLQNENFILKIRNNPSVIIGSK